MKKEEMVMGKEFELRFNNKLVRVWFALVIPPSILSTIILIF